MNASSTAEPALLAALEQAGLDTVEGAFSYAGGEDLSKANLGRRRRTKLCLMGPGGRVYELYLKRYDRQNLLGRLRHWLVYGRRGPARAEFQNVAAARAAGVPTMQEVCYGQEFHPWDAFCPLAATRGYVVVTAVAGASLEKCGREFLARNAARRDRIAELTGKLADLVRSLHQAGLVHRDLYSSHVFLDERNAEIGLYLIDLARMFRPCWRRFRWKVKDLAQLKYSMPPEWARQWWDSFLDGYLGDCGPALREKYSLAIERKQAAIARHARRRNPEARQG